MVCALFQFALASAIAENALKKPPPPVDRGAMLVPMGKDEVPTKSREYMVALRQGCVNSGRKAKDSGTRGKSSEFASRVWVWGCGRSVEMFSSAFGLHGHFFRFSFEHSHVNLVLVGNKLDYVCFFAHEDWNKVQTYDLCVCISKYNKHRHLTITITYHYLSQPTRIPIHHASIIQTASIF